MNRIELLQFSLGAAFDVLGQVVSDLTQEQADWLPPGTAVPIGALYWHAVGYSDELVHDYCMVPFKSVTQQEFAEAKLAKRDLGMGQTPLRHSAGWQAKVVLALPPENPEDPFWDLRAVREGLRVDLAALHEYAQATAGALQRAVAALTPEDLERTIATPIGDYAMDRFLALFVIWHINAHCGEISAIKGCQGLQGYPW
jgi:hypothetical protein